MFMKLLDMLASGHSLARAKEKPAPYRVVDGLLPAFGSQPAGGVPVRGWRRWASRLGLGRLAGLAASTPLREDRADETGAPRSAWGRAVRRRDPVQRELRLESVRVVRNDLRDEDGEVELAQPWLFAAAPGRRRNRGQVTSAPSGDRPAVRA